MVTNVTPCVDGFLIHNALLEAAATKSEIISLEVATEIGKRASTLGANKVVAMPEFTQRADDSILDWKSTASAAVQEIHRVILRAVRVPSMHMETSPLYNYTTMVALEMFWMPCLSQSLDEIPFNETTTQGADGCAGVMSDEDVAMFSCRFLKFL